MAAQTATSDDTLPPFNGRLPSPFRRALARRLDHWGARRVHLCLEAQPRVAMLQEQRDGGIRWREGMQVRSNCEEDLLEHLTGEEVETGEPLAEMVDAAIARFAAARFLDRGAVIRVRHPPVSGAQPTIGLGEKDTVGDVTVGIRHSTNEPDRAEDVAVWS